MLEKELTLFLNNQGSYRQGILLKNRTSFRIGGVCRGFFIPRGIPELMESLDFFQRRRISYKFISGGSNVLIDDQGIPEVVIALEGEGFSRICEKDDILYAEAGVACSRLLQFCIEHACGGLEFLAGVPARVAGAVRNNLSFQGFSLGSFVENVQVIEPGCGLRTFSKDQLSFSYRGSSLARCVIVAADLRVSSDEKSCIVGKIRENINLRKRTQPWGIYSAGCIFKNPIAGFPAGKILDECGLKGYRIGNAEVSQVHANFIVHRGQASFQDVCSLIEHMKKTVYQKKAVQLEEEIEIWFGETRNSNV